MTSIPSGSSTSSAPLRPAPSLNAQARSTFQSSFAKFEKTVKKLSLDDHRNFASTELEDVWKAAREVERELAARQKLRNLRRVEPFLKGLQSLSQVIEVLCNGTPYLSWIWAPVKLMLQLAANHTDAFEKLLDAYGRIAETLPRFDRYSKTKADPDFQKVLAIIYSDILEFHRRAYKFFRKSHWPSFFNSSWGRFEARFGCILASLSRHADLVDREANAFSIAETMHWRQEALVETAKRDKERLVAQLNSVLEWLKFGDVPYCSQRYQDDVLERLTTDCVDGTTEWMLQNQKMKAWLKNDYGGQPILWIKGKPGSGKSTLCAKLTQFLRRDGHSTVLFCFYTYHLGGSHTHPSAFIFATLLSQMLRQYHSLSSYLYVEYVIKGLSPSFENLKNAFQAMIPRVKAPRILIDGIDECVRHDPHGNPQDLHVMKDIIRDISYLLTPVNPHPKILLVSRDVLQLSGPLTKKPTLDLNDESDAVRTAIRVFTHQRLQDIRSNFQGFQAIDTVLGQLENEIVKKSQGMILWVQLILRQLEDEAYTLQDLETALTDMPIGLNDFYARIVARIGLLNVKSQERATRILQWIICAKRPLRLAELQGAIVFDLVNKRMTEKTKLPDNVINLCKPLVQTLADRTISFVHFTVHEYLLTSTFVKRLYAERTVSIDCLAYLQFSTELFELPVAEDEGTIQVCKGFHALQSYAYEHWLEHLLDYVSLHKTQGSQDDEEFMKFVHELCATVWRYQEQLQESNVETNHGPATEIQEPRLAHLKPYPSILELLTQVVQHRADVRSCFGDKMADAQSPSIDPTPFGRINSEYNRRLHLVLAAKTLPGIMPLELDQFKAVYGPFAYHCRFPGCSDTSTSFSTDDLRLRHENTHVPLFICTFSDCTYSLAFRSISALNRHIREHHVSEAPRIPDSLRIRSKHTSGQAPFQKGSESQPDIMKATRAGFDVLPTDTVGNSSPDVAKAYYCNWCPENPYYSSLTALMKHEVSRHFFRHPFAPRETTCMICTWGSMETPVIDSDHYLEHLESNHAQVDDAVGYISHYRTLSTK